MKTFFGLLGKLGRGSLFTALLLIIFALFGISQDQSKQILSMFNTSQPGFYNVSRFVDGDTIEIAMNHQTETVRFIGIDTPEKNHPEKPVQCFAEAASQHLADLIGSSPVRLEADPTNQNRDRYNRLLRYVYLPDGTLLNAKQIEDGYAFAYLSFPFVMAEEFKKLEDYARQSNLGLWNECKVYLENGYINTDPI